MRKLTFILSILSVLAVSLRTTALPPQWFEVEYHAYVEVFDLDNNPVSGVPVKLTVDAVIGDEERYSVIRTCTGYTNSNGYVSLTCYIDYYDYPQMNCMFVDVIEPGYTHATATGVYTTTSRTIYPDIWIMPLSADQDIDGIPDVWEAGIAEMFKPVLHRHSLDQCGGLTNFENLLLNNKFVLDVVDHTNQYVLYSQRVGGSLDALHKMNDWSWDTYGAGTQTINENYLLDLDDDQQDLYAPIGQRPVYYHVYREGSTYYLQYWYFFAMNDLGRTWHEGDWEHVSIKIDGEGAFTPDRLNNFTPVKVNFFTHNGGLTWIASTCWWSPTASNSYTGIDQGYTPDRTHLHIWIAENGHGSYNRHSLVHKGTYDALTVIPLGSHTDNADYEPSSYDLYFGYDFLVNLGEVDQGYYTTCPVSGATVNYHSYPRGSMSKHWLAYRGKVGYFYLSPSPYMPAKEAGYSHYWTYFEESAIFGNPDNAPQFGGSLSVEWVNDPGDGD
ncbi:Ig-like domain-containing protein [bacterium]|nr:Ig-like domain-containing protein [bacterium]